MVKDDEMLGAAFGDVGYDAWRRLVEAELKGQPFDRRLVRRTYDGIARQPVYTPADFDGAGDPAGFPGTAPFVRGALAGGAGPAGWDVRQLHVHPHIAEANAAIRLDLGRGVSSIQLRFDGALRRGLDAEAGADLVGQGGITAATVDDLDALLDGVALDRVPVALDAGAAFLPAAALLMALWQRRGAAADAVSGAFDADPLGALAELGELPMGTARALALLADLAGHAARHHPHVSAVGVDTSAYYDAGASDAQDVGFAVATGVSYLRALTDGGLDLDAALRQLAFTVPTGTELFPAIAKLRAGRRLWARVAEASGARAAGGMRQRARTAWRVLSQRDPWVNMLRTTVTCFAGAAGGAESVTVLPYDAALGVPSGFGRRIARNTQLLLREEAGLGRVTDPAGGAWYVERLTDELARAAWAVFQEVEAAGGMAAALSSGMVAERIAAVREERGRNLAHRRDALTGVSEFPDVAEQAVEPEPVDLAAVRTAAVRRAAVARNRCDAGVLAQLSGGDAAAVALAAAERGATLPEMVAALGGEAERREPLPLSRSAQAFEELRDAADEWGRQHGGRPAVFLANLGRIADYTARAAFARNFYAAGGIEAVDAGGHADAAAAAAAFRASGARIAVICGTDAQYETMAEAVGRALREAGATSVALAGRPGERRAGYEAAGIDRFVFAGSDVLAILRATLAHLGVIER